MISDGVKEKPRPPRPESQPQPLTIDGALAAVREVLEGMAARKGFGEIVVKVQSGRPIFVDLNERRRVG